MDTIRTTEEDTEVMPEDTTPEELQPQNYIPKHHLFRRLVGYVGRAFYDPRATLILDILATVNSMRDEHLATYLHLQHTKESNKLCSLLKQDGLMKVEMHTEVSASGPDGKQRKTPRAYWHIDYKLFVNVVKWKIYKIGKEIERMDNSKVAIMPYRCTGCHKEFSALDFAFLEKTVDMVPLCDLCNREIEVDEEAANTNGMSEKFTLFMDQCKPIIELLKQIDEINIPSWISDQSKNFIPNAHLDHQDVSFDVKTNGSRPKPVIVEFEGEDTTAKKQGAMDGADNDTTLAMQKTASLASNTNKDTQAKPERDSETGNNNRNRKRPWTAPEEVEEPEPPKEDEDIAAYYSRLTQGSTQEKPAEDSGSPQEPASKVAKTEEPVDDDDDDFEEVEPTPTTAAPSQPTNGNNDNDDDDDDFEEV